MEYLLQCREMNYWLGVGKWRQTYEATNMMNICSADAGISALQMCHQGDELVLF